MNAIFFDLFFTLITPDYPTTETEYEPLHLTASEWESYAEDDQLYNERALGHITSQTEIIHKIVSTLPYPVTKSQEDLVLKRRLMRMKHALQSVRHEILTVLKELKNRGYLIGLISNADTIDCAFWKESNLYPYFDAAFFSCDYGMLKPDPAFYQIAMKQLNVTPQQSIFVGDGGSNELAGAKSVGMKTVFSEALIQKPQQQHEQLIGISDYYMNSFTKLLHL